MPMPKQTLRLEPNQDGSTATNLSTSFQDPKPSRGHGKKPAAKLSRTKPNQSDRPPGTNSITGALKSVLNSPEFKSAPQLQAFLHFVVDAAVKDQREKLKGITIAIEALGRPSNFDPAKDPIVRVEAARLRLRLSKYYNGTGASDPVRISIPKGGYAPAFEFANATVITGSAKPVHDLQSPDPLTASQDSRSTLVPTRNKASAPPATAEIDGPGGKHPPKESTLKHRPVTLTHLKTALSQPRFPLGWLVIAGSACFLTGYWAGSE